MVTVGLDLSLAKTGLVVLNEDGVIHDYRLIKSKPAGDKPSAETRRIVKIAEDIMEAVDNALPDVDPDLVVIEGLAFMARNTSALVQLSGLNYLTRVLLDELKWPFLIVTPSSLKKFITQKGNSDKNVMMMTIYKDYGHEFFDDNICDAFSLAACGLAVLDKPLKEMTIPQKEVVTMLKTQL